MLDHSQYVRLRVHSNLHCLIKTSSDLALTQVNIAVAKFLCCLVEKLRANGSK